MATLTNLALQNAAAANVTFSVVQASPADSVLVNRARGITAFFDRLRIRTRMASKSDVMNRAQVVLTMPVVRAVNGVDTVVGQPIQLDCRISLPDIATTTEKNDAYALFRNALANALIQGAVRDGDYLN